MISIEISRTTQADLRKLSKQLRTVGDAKVIRRESTKRLRAAARPAQQRVKAAARGLPAKGPKSSGLRRRTANAITTQVRMSGRMAGVNIRIPTSRMGGLSVLPQRMNAGRWRHPVYGNREVWVTQTSRAGWFDRTLQMQGPGVRREIKRVLDDIERKLGD